MLCIVMEWAQGGDLNQIIQKLKKMNQDENIKHENNNSHSHNLTHSNNNNNNNTIGDSSSNGDTQNSNPNSKQSGSYANGKRYIKEIFIWKYFIEACHGIKYLHDHHIVHRDIKPMNTFLSKNNTLKLGDMGVCLILNHANNDTNHHGCNNNDLTTSNSISNFKKSEKSSKNRKRVGTPLFIAPEVIANQLNHEQYPRDIWSLGCMIYMLMTHCAPFKGNTSDELKKRIIESNYTHKKSLSYYSNYLQNLIKKLLNKNPSQRPTANQLIREYEQYFQSKSIQNQSINNVDTTHSTFIDKITFTPKNIDKQRNHTNENQKNKHSQSAKSIYFSNHVHSHSHSHSNSSSRTVSSSTIALESFKKVKRNSSKKQTVQRPSTARPASHDRISSFYVVSQDTNKNSVPIMPLNYRRPKSALCSRVNTSRYSHVRPRIMRSTSLFALSDHDQSSKNNCNNSENVNLSNCPSTYVRKIPFQNSKFRLNSHLKNRTINQQRLQSNKDTSFVRVNQYISNHFNYSRCRENKTQHKKSGQRRKHSNAAKQTSSLKPIKIQNIMDASKLHNVNDDTQVLTTSLLTKRKFEKPSVNDLKLQLTAR